MNIYWANINTYFYYAILICILFQNTQTNKENAIIKYYINNVKEKF